LLKFNIFFIGNTIIRVTSPLSEQKLNTMKSPNKEKVLVRKIIATLNWKISFPEQYFLAKFIRMKMAIHSRFPEPWPQGFGSLNILDGLILDFEKAILAAMLGGIGTATAVKRASKTLYKELQSIKGMVQLDINEFPLLALITCLEAGFDYKSMAVRGPRKNKAEPGHEPGTIMLSGEGQRHHDWQISRDGGITAEDLPTTSGGETLVENLESKVEYLFRCRLVLSKGKRGKWTDWFPGTAP